MLEARVIPALYAVLPPDRLDVATSDLRPVLAGSTLADLLPHERGRRYVCAAVGAGFGPGSYIGRDHWSREPAPGQVVVFHQPVLGGGGNGGSDTGTVLRVIVAAAAAYISQTYGAGYGAAFALLGGLAVNALVPIPRAPSQEVRPSSANYSFGSQGNTARIDQPIPELFGHMSTFPDFASPPYYEYTTANDQFFCATFLVSEGQLDVLRVSIDDTPIDNFDDVQVARCGAGQSSRDGPGTGYETLAEQTLVDPAIVTAIEVAGVEMPQFRTVGPFIPLRAEYRATAVFIDVILPRGLDVGRSVSWRVNVRPVDDFGLAVGAWATVGEETIDSASVTPIRRSYGYELAEAIRPQVLVVRTDLRTTDDGAAHDISWAALRCRLNTAGVAHDGSTYLAIRVRASQQLSQITQARFRVLARRLLPMYADSSDGWSEPQATRNPAWALAYVLRARGLTDDQIDLDQLLVLAATWDARQDRFDAIFDQPNTVWDALTTIGRVGRAVPLIRASTFTFWRDQAETAAVGAFTMRDIIAGSFALQFSLPDGDPVDAIDLEYFDRRRWDWVTVTAQYVGGVIYGYRGIAERAGLGLSAPTGPARLRVEGIIGENQAIRTAVYHLADLVYRPTRATFGTELQGLLPAYGSLVSLHHDVGDFGQGGEAAEWDEGELTLQTTEPLAWTAGATHYVRLVRPVGTVTDRIAVTRGDGDRGMVLSEAPDFEPEVYGVDRERTRYVFGPAENVEGLAKVRSIVPRSQRQIDLELVLEDDRVHTSDVQWLPGVDEQDPVDDGSAGDGVIDDGTYFVRLTNRAIAVVSNDMDRSCAGIKLLNDGSAATRIRWLISVPTEETAIPDEWLPAQPVSTAVAGLFEVRATILATYYDPPSTGPDWADVGELSDAFDTWLSLGTTRQWVMTANIYQAAAYVLIEIRTASTGVVQEAKTFHLSVVQFDPGPPP